MEFKYGLLTLIAIDLVSHRTFKFDCFGKVYKHLDGPKVTGQIESVGACLHMLHISLVLFRSDLIFWS